MWLRWNQKIKPNESGGGIQTAAALGSTGATEAAAGDLPPMTTTTTMHHKPAESQRKSSSLRHGSWFPGIQARWIGPLLPLPRLCLHPFPDLQAESTSAVRRRSTRGQIKPAVMKMNVPPLSSIRYYYGLCLCGAGFQTPPPTSRSPGLLRPNV